MSDDASRAERPAHDAEADHASNSGESDDASSADSAVSDDASRAERPAHDDEADRATDSDEPESDPYAYDAEADSNLRKHDGDHDAASAAPLRGHSRGQRRSTAHGSGCSLADCAYALVSPPCFVLLFFWRFQDS